MMKIKNTEITVIQGDITRIKAGAIVNAANNKLVMGGGVAGAIKRIGGSVIEEEAVKKGPIEIGEAIFTGAGKLDARYVIHAATMGMDFKTDEVKIRTSARNALLLAEKLDIDSIVIPALGCGTGGFPLLASAKIMAQETHRHVRENTSKLKKIIFCLYDQEALKVFEKGVIGYLTHVTEVLHYGPLVTVDALIELDGGIVVIERSNPPFGLALPGGFVDYGESLEAAVKRETKEETNLDVVELRQFHTYSDPKRDPRFHTIGTVYVAKVTGNPQAGDDAAGLRIIKSEEIAQLEFAFDHKKVLLDYLAFKEGKNPF